MFLMASASLIRDLTPLLLGGTALFVVARSGILGGAGEAVEGVGEGLGRAGRGLGAGISDIARGAGGAVGGLGQGLREVFIQGGESIREIVRETGGVGTDILGEETGARGILQNVGGLGVDVTSFLRNETGQTLDRLGSVDDRLVSFAKEAFTGAPVVVSKLRSVLSGGSVAAQGANVILGGVSSAAQKAAGFLTTEKAEGGNISLPTGSSGGSLQTLAPTPREIALRQSLPASERNKPPQSIPPKQSTLRKITSGISGFFSRLF